ncbi:prospero homeobox 3 [Lampris incognitus]|uniref:prospero homeobox 3 n=1 Tax=Lampris incognitus TaxID=2546036 RepID=UPI0024B60779|nr:prospero homeobox 3 [Lampris incognitus]
MASPTDLFDEPTPEMQVFGPPLCTTESDGGRPPPISRPLGFPLIHHLLQPLGAPKRMGGQLQPNSYNPNHGTHRYLDCRIVEEQEKERDGDVGRGVGGGQEGGTRVEEGLFGVKKRRTSATLVAEWSQDVLRVKKMKLENVVGRREGDTVEGSGRRGRRREGRRREREELKEQLEEARGRLRALQEKVWRAFGEKHTEEDLKKRSSNKNGDETNGGKEEKGMSEEEDVTEGMFDEGEINGGDMDDSASLHPAPRLHNLHQQGRTEEREKDRERGGSGEKARGGESYLEGVMERAGMWLGCSELVREEWDRDVNTGEEEEEEEEQGGQKFAQALKLELGSAVARVIDRVLRLYTETTELASPSPPTSISFLPPEIGNEGGRERGAWMELLMREGGEEKRSSNNEQVDALGGERERRPQRTSNGSAPSLGRSDRREHPVDPATALAIRRSHDQRKANPLLGPSLPAHLPSSHPNLPLHQPSLRRHPPPPHPSLLPPPSQPKGPSSFLHSSSSSSFPPPPPPLPLPFLHYSMQQLFSRSFTHPQLPHLPPSHKDYLSSDPFLEFPPHPSSHPSYPPLPLLGHLEPSLAPHPHGDRERDRVVRGDGSIRGGVGVDRGELYLQSGGTQEGLSPCHLKKAKLMFFYTRYPSSNTLKTYFPDVKFNRCVTSQLIKWFSNFREFFYIQMERFARQAVRESLTRDGGSRAGREGQLRMGRDTELYRILNMHYNKSNVYQVPDRFVEVSEVALREFYSAIHTGRDSDPCWKKGIYKIVCKLDGPVPDTFRLPGCPVG